MLKRQPEKGRAAEQPLSEILTREEIFAAVKDALCGDGSFMGCEVENVTESASLRDDLGLDSLDHAELAVTLEEMLNIDTIEYDEVDEADTVGHVVKLLGKKRVFDAAVPRKTMARIAKAAESEKSVAKKVAAERKTKVKPEGASDALEA